LNDTEIDYNKWEGVALGNPELDFTDAELLAHQSPIFQVQALSEDDPHNIAILQQPLPSGGAARALISGSTWLRLIEEPLERFIWVGSNASLEHHRVGRIEVLRHYNLSPSQPLQVNALGLGPVNNFGGLNLGPAQAFASSGYMAFCLIQHFVEHPIMYAFSLRTGVSSRLAVADIYTLNGLSASLYETNKVLYDNRDIFYELNIGDTGYCMWQNERYYIIQAPCSIEL